MAPDQSFQANMKVYLNGQMVDAHDAKVSVADAGFQHAVGLFETMGVYHGRVFRLRAYLDRLERSAKELGLLRDLPADGLKQAVMQTVEANGFVRARLRLTVTPGDIPIFADSAAGQATPQPTVLVVATPPTQYDPAYFEKGITVLVAPPGANPFDATAGHKTLAYWSRLRTLRQAAAVGAGEAIWLNVTNHLASGAISNVFLVKDGKLLTPFARGEELPGALPAPVLPGITRATVIELAEAMGISVERKMLSVDDLLSADEVFLTNSSWVVLPVAKVEKHQVGGGGDGSVTRRLRTAVLDLIEQETSATPDA